ncbi:MAG: hypothetical protein KDH96_05970 [Candidatus Riesia sp.]|nr:hypothetical protein [Candidatus Riesia sp.]
MTLEEFKHMQKTYQAFESLLHDACEEILRNASELDPFSGVDEWEEEDETTLRIRYAIRSIYDRGTANIRIPLKVVLGETKDHTAFGKEINRKKLEDKRKLEKKRKAQNTRDEVSTLKRLLKKYPDVV